MIGAAIAAALPILRAQAESLMTDLCTIERHDGTSWSTVHADLQCHLEEPSTTSRSLLTDEAVTPETPVLKVPATVVDVEPDDRVTIAGRAHLWVSRAAPDDSTTPVETLIQCRWSR